MTRLSSTLVALGVVLGVVSSAWADVPLHRVLQATETRADRGRTVVQLAGPEVIVEVESRARAIELGLRPVTENYAIGQSDSLAALSALTSTPGVRHVSWSPGRTVQLNRAAEQIELAEARADFGVNGQGVIVGVIDTGIDITHPAVRNSDGSTRIKWLLSYGEPPLGVHARLEERYGCTQSDECAVYSSEDIDFALEEGAEDVFFPDDIGHGTHITSIAAGSDTQFPGIAPAADLVIVQAAGQTGTVSDARILTGAQFIFDRAGESGQPAVVNVSLGSGFGAHDGASAIERALTQVSRGSGRALVVASGNDGNLFSAFEDDLAEPLGKHAAVFVPEGAEARIPVITPPGVLPTHEGGFFVWLSSEPEAEISVAFANDLGARTSFVGPGGAASFTSRGLGDPDAYDVFITSGQAEDLGVRAEPGSIIVGFDGSWASGRVFDLVLRGKGLVKCWAQGIGDASEVASGFGILFPRARASGTVTIPASAPALISVGASVNRNSWTDYRDSLVEFPLGTVGERAPFSGAGPNGLGQLKPDLLAPGGNVAAAMSDASDPRDGDAERSQFQAGRSCPEDEECFVVDDLHGVASGTSMATPVVTGAVALLFQRDPSLTMEDARLLLRAGTKPARGAGADRGLSGAGVLDIAASLRALDLEVSGKQAEPVADESRIVWADGFVQPFLDAPLRGLALLRSHDGSPAGGFRGDLLSARVEGPGRAEVEMRRPGLADLTLHAEPGSGRSELLVEVLYDGEVVVDSRVPVRVDNHDTNYGPALGGGTCAWGVQAGAWYQPGVFSWPWALPLLLVFCRRRRRS